MSGPIFTAGELLRALHGEARGALPARVDGVSTDTRTLESGALFVALRGERFDAHTLLGEAAGRGASAAVVMRGVACENPAGLPLIEVESTLAALGALARHHRRRFSIPIGALTGTNGKTTTKEMVAAILSERGTALSTQGNLNNEIGVPLTLLKLGEEHRAAIIEMGMNHEGELRRLSTFAEPCAAAIVSIGKGHLAGLGTLERVARAKGEIFEGLVPEGLAIVDAGDPLALEAARASRRRITTFGAVEGAEVRLVGELAQGAEGLRARVRLSGRWAEGTNGERELELALAFVGAHNAKNAAAAFAMGLALGATPEQCAAGLAKARPYRHRLELVQVGGGVTVLDDCYNANPTSMAAALAALRSIARGRRTAALLGDMLELGEEEERFHGELGALAAESGLALLVGVGPRSAQTCRAARQGAGEALEVLHVAEPEQPEVAAGLLRERLAPGDLLLVKGSRGMKLERVIALLAKEGEGGRG